jgi:hypothetical protein
MSLAYLDEEKEYLEGVDSDKDSTLLAKRVWERLLSPMSHDPSSELLSQCLAAAAEDGNLLAVQNLVQFGVDINRPCEGPYRNRTEVSGDAESPLYRAVQKMMAGWRRFDLYLPTLKYLLESGAKPDLTFAVDHTALELCLQRHANDESDKVAHAASPCRGTSGQFDPRSDYRTALEMAVEINSLNLFEQLLEACVLNDDDFLAIWHLFVAEEGYQPFRDGLLLEELLDLDTNQVIAKQTEDPLRALLALEIVPTHVFLRLLDHGAEITPAYDDLTTAFRNNAAPGVVRALLDWMPNTQSQCYRDKQRALGGLVLNGGLAPKLGTDSDSVDGLVYCDMEYNPYLVGDKWACAVLRVFLGSGASAHEAENEGDTWLSPFELAMERPLVNKQIVQIILKCQPLRDYPHIDASRYIRQLCGDGNFSLLRSVVASANDGEAIIKSEATSLSLAILQGASRRLTTVQEVVSVIDCLEYVFRISDGRAFDVPVPVIDPSDEPPAREEKLTRMNKVATAR